MMTEREAVLLIMVICAVVALVISFVAAVLVKAIDKKFHLGLMEDEDEPE